MRERRALAQADELGVRAESARAAAEDRSPTANSLTAVPTASTSPANSIPRILRFGRSSPAKARQKNGFAARMWQSVRVTVVAWTLTRTSLSAGTGRSTSSIRSTSGPP